LTRYGGVGSKSRKGFGSLEPVTISGIGGIEDCQRIAKETRTLLEVSSAEKDRTPAIEDRIEKGPVLFKNATSLHVLNEVGYSLSMFGAMHAHNAEKKTLGLPRKVDTKEPRRFVVDRAVGDRHASPWHLKISTSTEGLEVRYIAFPSPWLGGPALSKEWLNKLGDHLMADLKRRANEKATITSDFAQNPGVGTAVRPVGPPKPLVYTPKVVSGLEKLIKEFPARSFVVGQSNSNAKKVDEFLGIAKAIERTDEVEKYFAEIKSALQLHDKGKLKEYRKNRPYLQPLVDFLLGDPQR
jgi:CRISPR-associated protein Cmr6